ncbi:MAG: chromosomal replication initiator protein DnaA [Rickettsia sp.]|nr:chromosomal replication initiator protein DnaA [Rickettsia sp.]
MLHSNISEIGKNNNSYHYDLFCNILAKLEKIYGEYFYQNWFSKIEFLEISSYGSIILTVPSNFIKNWIKVNYLNIISNLFKECDSNIKLIEIITRENKSFDKEQNTEKQIYKNTLVTNNISKISDTLPKKISYLPKYSNNNCIIFENLESILDSRFTFKNFVVGSSNELAYAASLAVAESNNASVDSNPLFLYGGVGLGKTHLMHAIAWHVQQNFPKKKIIYISAEKFMYLFVKSIRNKDVVSFKEYFRSVDILMIDDIQFICGKNSTQEEFFHTFNAIIDNNSQIVISCDRSPSDLEEVEERIKSRLGWGLVADVHNTTYELRLGILLSKIEQIGVKMPKNVIEFLAKNIKSNVRELEGALNKVLAHQNLVKKDITLDSTKEILRDLIRSNIQIITLEQIKEKVSERYNVKKSDLASSRRLKNISLPRQVAMYLSKTLTTKSLLDIGNSFGKRNHTTILHAIKKIENLLKLDLEIKEDIQHLTKILKNI